MSSTNITIRIGENLKKEAEELYSDLGVNFTTVLTSCIKQSVREQRIPFTITQSVLNKKARHAMDQVLEGKNLSRKFTSVKELMDDLNADD